MKNSRPYINFQSPTAEVFLEIAANRHVICSDYHENTMPETAFLRAQIAPKSLSAGALVQSVSVFSLAVFLWALLPEIKWMMMMMVAQ